MAAIVVGALLPACGGASKSPPAASPEAVDVSAAKACEAFSTYLGAAANGKVPAAVGQAVVGAAGQLVAAAQSDEKANRPLPKWLQLGADILAAVQDVVKADSTDLQKDGAAVATQCHSIPAAAQVAGGYVTHGP